jgi:MFS family permease
MSRAREYGLTLSAIVLGAAVALFSLNRAWLITTEPVLPGATNAVLEEAFTGAQMLTGASAASWAALMCALAVVATRRVGRVLAGIVIALAGLYLAVQSALFPASFGEQGSIASWWIPAMIAAVVLVLSGALVILRGRVWPTLSRRYERGAKPPEQESAWEALDAGRDPTLADD